jgi:6-phosphogluconate dehydrogenase
MKLGMVGLGRMGSGMTERLRRDAHEVMTYDPKVESTASSLEELASQLEAPRIVWLMIPAGDPTESAFGELLGVLEAGDAIVDGGNSNFRDSKRRNQEAAEHGVDFLDVGVSGGIWGLEEGYCLMAGGPEEPVGRLEPVLRSLAPEGGWAHVGPSGAGHFVKMVHNGIEYGLMQAYAEGFDVLKGRASEKLPEDERFAINLPDVAEVWRRGSVISSWLLDLCALELARDHDLDQFSGRVADSGEGHWTVDAAMEEAVPANVLAAALFARYRSRIEQGFADKLLSAMRFGFGGHVEMPQ